MVEMLASGAELGQFVGPQQLEQLTQRTATTDANGRFTIANLPTGNHRVYAAHPDHPGAGGGVTLSKPGEHASLDIGLQDGGGIAGRVTDDAGKPKVDESVVAFSFMIKGRMAKTSEKGEYEIKGLAAGSYFVNLGIDLQGQAERGGGGGRVGANFLSNFVAKTANVEMGRVTRVDFGNEPKTRLAGLVTRAGNPVKEAFLQFFPEGGVQGLSGATTNEEGRYSVELMPGKYLARIDNVSESIEVPAGGGEVEKDFRLPSGALSGRVTNAATGEPLRGARVTIYKGDRQGQGDTLTSALGAQAGDARVRDDGTFRVGGLAPGTYTVTAGSDGFALARVDGIEIPPEAEATGLDLACEPGGIIRGIVRLETGEPVTDARIWIVDAQAKDLGAGDPPRTDDEGRFEVRRFGPGRYRVTVLTETHAPWRKYVDFPDPGHASGAVELAVTVVPGGTLEVSVRGEQGYPIPGAAVELRYPDGDRVITGFMDFVQPTQPAGLDGKFRKSRLPPGPLVGIARYSEPGKPTLEGTFDATIIDRGEVQEGVIIHPVAK
jgi:large repetitive protein